MSCCHGNGNAIVLRVFNLNNESHYSLARCVCHDNCTVNLSHSKSPSLKRNKYCRVCALPCPSLITRFSCVFMRDSRGTRTTSSSEEAIRKFYEREAQAKELSIADCSTDVGLGMEVEVGGAVGVGSVEGVGVVVWLGVVGALDCSRRDRRWCQRRLESRAVTVWTVLKGLCSTEERGLARASCS